MNFNKAFIITVIIITIPFSLYALDFNGKIILPEKATPAEQTAADELSNYLTQMGCSNIQIITEENAVAVGSGAIWLGPTQKAADLKKISDFTPDKARFNGNSLLNYVSDTDAASGYAVRLAPGTNPGNYYTLPMLFGAYSPSQNKAKAGTLTAADVIGPGYHYYQLMDFIPTTNDFYFYFFGNWTLQYNMGGVFDQYGSNVHYKVWASIKFTGPAYPFGSADDPNGIYIERVFLVRDAVPLDFNSNQATLNGNSLLSVVATTDTESNYTVQLLPGDTPNSYYTMPLLCGAYSASQGKVLGSATFNPARVSGTGYHYYKLLNFTADSDFYIYFFGNWSLQYHMNNVVAENGPGKYSVWSRLKFTGPTYPYGISTDPNAVYIDRVILVKDDKPLVTLPAGTPNLNGNNLLAMVSDTEAPSGHASCLTPGADPASHYIMPILCGAYSASLSKLLGVSTLNTANVPGAGYHDYALTTFTPIANNFYIYFFGNWTLQYPMSDVLVTNGPNINYTVHANIKFTGPAYPYGNANDPNGIYIDNVRLVPNL